MNRLFRDIVLSIAIAGIGMAIIGGILYGLGARINTSKSIPQGLYWMSDAPVVKGHYVIFCPPQSQVFEDARSRGYISSGFCPGGYGSMMKKILAAQGDTVSITAQGVTVNGELISHSKPLSVDRRGRSLFYMSKDYYTLGENDLLLMTDRSPTSFDARYFGILSRVQVKSVIRPVLIW